MAKAEYRSAIRSRNLIKQALADLLLEKPLDKITVTDIVKRANINRGTFYAHYMDVPNVIENLIQETFLNIREAISADSYTLGSTLLYKIKDLLSEDMPFYQKIMNSSASTILHQQLSDLLLTYLFQHEEDFRVGSHEDFMILMHFCAGGLSNLYHDWFAGKLPLTLEELTQQAEQLVNTLIYTEHKTPVQ